MPCNFPEILYATLVILSSFSKSGVAGFWPVHHGCFVKKNDAPSTALISLDGNGAGVLWSGLTSILSDDELDVLMKS
jgi:hypothetical protein